MCYRYVATLALGLRPRKGVARLRAKRETRESLHMLPRIQRVWGNEPSHSQVNSHVGNWSPERTRKSSECNSRHLNSLPWKVIYIIGKLLKCRYIKWARIAHLDIWNTSYGQKKGGESNWYFDSWSLKVDNWPDSLACKWRASYRWKALDKGYNFASDFIAFGGLHKKLCALTIAGIPIVAISGLSLGSPGTKKPFGCGPRGEAQSIL